MYRIFIDEVGNADLKSSRDPNHQYLSLTGVIVNLDTYDAEMDARFRSLKRTHFGSENVVLHRRDILDFNPPFDVLKDEYKQRAFSDDLLSAMRELEYVVLTVAIDKQAHFQRYGRWQFHSYHYCLTCMIERYVKWLNRFRDRRGDVMAESRNGRDDEKLKESYKRFYQRGSRYESERARLDRLTSGELKLRKKTANINGLQMADLLASPSFRRMLCERRREPITAPFGRQVAEIIMGKYDTSGGPNGMIQGYGCKWLP